MCAFSNPEQYVSNTSEYVFLSKENVFLIWLFLFWLFWSLIWVTDHLVGRGGGAKIVRWSLIAPSSREIWFWLSSFYFYFWPSFRTWNLRWGRKRKKERGVTFQTVDNIREKISKRNEKIAHRRYDGKNKRKRGGWWWMATSCVGCTCFRTIRRPWENVPGVKCVDCARAGLFLLYLTVFSYTYPV